MNPRREVSGGVLSYTLNPLTLNLLSGPRAPHRTNALARPRARDPHHHLTLAEHARENAAIIIKLDKLAPESYSNLVWREGKRTDQSTECRYPRGPSRQRSRQAQSLRPPSLITVDNFIYQNRQRLAFSSRWGELAPYFFLGGEG